MKGAKFKRNIHALNSFPQRRDKRKEWLEEMLLIVDSPLLVGKPQGEDEHLKLKGFIGLYEWTEDHRPSSKIPNYVRKHLSDQIPAIEAYLKEEEKLNRNFFRVETYLLARKLWLVIIEPSFYRRESQLDGQNHE